MAKTQLEFDAWDDLNAALMKADRKTAEGMLDAERKGRQRKMFLLRIHSRINKLRAHAERQELIKLSEK